jgi:glycosyltransferase involved in cell wall biosynthesis
VSDRIEWTGRLPHHEAVRRLEECDILLAPHVQLADVPFFGSPTKLFEYMALGRPIVASRLEQIAEILEHGRTALLAEPGNFEDLARTINDVLAMPDRGRSLGEEARAEVVKNHTWDQRAAIILSRLGIRRDSVNPSEDSLRTVRHPTC